MADLQFLSNRMIVNSCVIFLMACFLAGFIFTPECAAWIFFHKPAYEGKVVDAETGEPIEGVAVVAVYWKSEIIGGPAGPNSRAINWRETLTDKKGFFRFPSYTTLVAPNAEAGETRFIFYKPGYRSSPVWSRRQFLRILGPDTFFTEEIGKKEEKEFGIKKEVETVTYGVITLKPANTWDERRRSIPSRPYDSSEEDLPILYEYVKKERERLYRNKEWRQDEENR